MSIARILTLWLIFSLSYTQADSLSEDKFWGSDGTGVRQPLMQAVKINHWPDFIQNEFQGNRISVYVIDLDSDGEEDYIVHHDNAFRTCFIRSDNSRRSCEKLGYGDGFIYYWFVQLDDDPMLELFSMAGDEHYDDYELYSFDQKSWKRQRLFDVLPVIMARDNDPGHKGIYWGYPWDVKGLQVRRTGKNPYIRASFSYQKSHDEDERDPIAPVIFFDGVPSQGGVRGYFQYLENDNDYYTLSELKQRYSDNNLKKD